MFHPTDEEHVRGGPGMRPSSLLELGKNWLPSLPAPKFVTGSRFRPIVLALRNSGITEGGVDYNGDPVPGRTAQIVARITF